MTKLQNSNLTGAYAASLAITEIGLGAILHAGHIPFTGHLLSLNQIFILTKATHHPDFERLTPLSISIIAASLKALAPIGKKLTPMLAIFMQGLLFNLPICLFGNRLMGHICGAFLASLWGFAQPLLIYYLIFGRTLFDAIFLAVQEITKKLIISESFIYIILAACLLIKGLLACLVVVMAEKFPFDWLSKNKDVMVDQKGKNSFTPVYGAIRDILMPSFLIASLISLGFTYVMERNFESLFWMLCRQVAVGYLFFWGLRKLPMHKVAEYFQKRRHSSLGKAFQVALERVQRRQDLHD